VPIRRFLLPVPFPDTLSLSVSSVLHMKTRIFHVNFYGLAANDAGDTSWEEDRPAVLSSEWRRACVFLRDHSLPHSAKQLVGGSRKTLAYLVADFRIVLRHF
jgi:hypothetical protein